MARCGRCGLWESYPQNDPDRMWAGACLWYQIRLADGFVYDSHKPHRPHLAIYTFSVFEPLPCSALDVQV